MSGQSNGTGSVPSIVENLAQCPEWANRVELDDVKRGVWFRDVYMDWRPKWPGVVEVICPTDCIADWLTSNYLVQIAKIAREKFSGVTSVLIRPQDYSNSGIKTWCYKSGMASSQSDSDGAKERVSLFMEEWRQGQVTSPKGGRHDEHGIKSSVPPPMRGDGAFGDRDGLPAV